MRHNKKVMILAVSIGLSSGSAQAQDLGQLLGGLQGIMGGLNGIMGMLGQGSIMGLVSMIPGLNFLAGVGPILDIVKMIPGMDSLLSSIPGLNQVLGLLGMAGGGNLGPLTSQINNVGKWISSVRNMYENVKGIIMPQDFANMTTSINSLLQMSGSNRRLSENDFKNNPAGAAQVATAALKSQQQQILAKITKSGSDAETAALRIQAQLLQDSFARTQRTANNATALKDAQKIAENSAKNVEDTLNYTTSAAQALKDNKKVEDINKIVGSATLEMLRLQAADASKITALLANQMKVQVSQAEALGEIVNAIQTDRMEKAQAISNALQEQDAAYKAQLEADKRKASQLGIGFSGLFRTGGKVLGE